MFLEQFPKWAPCRAFVIYFLPAEMKITKFKQQQQNNNKLTRNVSRALCLRFSLSIAVTCCDNLKYVTGHYTLNNKVLFKRSAYRFKSIAILSMQSTGG